MGKAKFYDADQVVIYFAGARIQGYADGEFCTISQMTEGFTEVAGTDGEVARSKSNDNRTKVEIKLLQTSASNLFLSGIHTTDLKAPNGAGVATFQMQDLSGNSICSGTQAWIVKYSDSSYDRTAKERTWEIHIADANRVVGGN